MFSRNDAKAKAAQSKRPDLDEFASTAELFSSAISIYDITSEGSLKIKYVSSGLASLCETDAGALRRNIDRNILYGVHPEDRKKAIEVLRGLKPEQNEHEAEYRFVSEGGNVKHIRVHIRQIRNEDGSSTAYASYDDLTQLRRVDHMIDVALVNTGVSLWEYDFKRRCIIQYQNSAEMHGFETIVPNVPQSLVESGFVHPDSAPAFLAMYDKLFRGEPFAEGVFKVLTSNRQSYWYEHIRYNNSYDENGRPCRAIGMSTDETQRQEAIAKYERELEKERGFMEKENLLAHATFDLTTGETLDYYIANACEASEHEETIFTYGKVNAELLIDDEERARFLELNDTEKLIRRFSSGETEFKLEYRRKMPLGGVTWVRNNLRLLRDPRSRHILLFDYWYDIESEKMLELMHHSIATDNYDFVARIDGRTGHFTSLPKEELTYHIPPRSGDDADAVTLSMYNDCLLDEDRETVIHNSLIANIKEHLKNRSRYIFTYRMNCPDGSVQFKKITQYYIDPQREIIAVTREDITELIHEETEKNRVLSEALESAKQASLVRSQFLSRVSHELRTPLNAIIGFLELAKDASAEQASLYLSNSSAAAKQLLSIINDVLDVSYIESGKMKIAHTPFDFSRLIKNITSLFEPQCRSKGVEYKTILLTPVDGWLLGDQLRVNQILLNLLNNAVKFTDSGHVHLKISKLPVQNDKVIVRFVISDTGCGMSEEMQGRLFKPFERENSVTAQKYGGSGLGLSISGSLVSLMDGVISVQSRPGEGTTFTVDIPFAKGEPEAAMGTIDGAESLHVLAIDDDEAVLEYISAILKRIGVRYSCARDGASGLSELNRRLWDNDEYNVCLVDWEMKGMNGLETTRKIRERFGKDLIIIVISSYDHYQADESVKAAGANMFITKPLFQSSLFDLFSTLTNGKIVRKGGVPGEFHLNDMRILLAEGNAMNRMVAENMILRKFGAKCECAADGKIALDMFLSSDEGYYDAILMDIQMPNMDGYEATRRIRSSAHPDAQDVQIIALTANAFSEDVTRSLSSGMNAHVSKPIESEVLGSALAEAYAQRSGAQ